MNQTPTIGFSIKSQLGSPSTLLNAGRTTNFIYRIRHLKYDATGGYLIIKKDGDVLCYHIYNRNDFENYLINKTKLETASTKKHEFGELYTENGELFFKLNLQIRFIK